MPSPRLFALITVLALLPQANAQNSNHPLEGVAVELGRTAGELDSISSKVEKDPELKAAAAGLKERVSALAMDALTAPIKIKSAKISEYGYDISWRNDPTHNYGLYIMPASERLKQEAQALKPQRWQALAQLVEQQMKNVEDLQAVVKRPEITAALTGKDRQMLEDMSLRSHTDALEDLQAKVGQNLDCIQDMSAVYKQTGLRPMAGSGPVAWDVQELNRVYGVMDLSDLNGDAAKKALQGLLSIRSKASQHYFVCIQPEAGKFMNGEIEKLKAKVK